MVVIVPKRVAISNFWLNLVYYTLCAVLFGGLLAQFILRSEYTTTIPLETTLLVNVPEDSIPRVQAYPMEGYGPCRRNATGDAITMYGRDFRIAHSSCVELCNGHTDSYITEIGMWNCEDVTAGISLPSASEMDLISSRHHAVFGTPGSYYIDLFPAIQGLEVRFSYRYSLTEPIPWFFGFGEEARMRKDSSSEQGHSSTVLLDHQGRPWKEFRPGVPLVLSIIELVWAAQEADHAVHLGRDTGVREDGLSVPPRELRYEALQKGLGLDVSVTCFGNDADTGLGISFGATLSRPVCLLSVQLVQVGSSHNQFTGETVPTYWLLVSQIRVRCRLGSGMLRAPETAAITVNITMALMILTLPMVLVRFIANHMLGSLSNIFQRATVQPFTLREDIGGTATALMSASVAFLQLSDTVGPDGTAHGGISRDRLVERLMSCLENERVRGGLKQSEIEAYVDWIFSHAINERHADAAKPKARIISIDDFSKAYLRSATMDFDTIVRLFSRTRRRYFLERFFTPGALSEILATLPEPELPFNPETDFPCKHSKSNETMELAKARETKEEEWNELARKDVVRVVMEIGETKNGLDDISRQVKDMEQLADVQTAKFHAQVQRSKELAAELKAEHKRIRELERRMNVAEDDANGARAGAAITKDNANRARVVADELHDVAGNAVQKALSVAVGTWRAGRARASAGDEPPATPPDEEGRQRAPGGSPEG